MLVAVVESKPFGKAYAMLMTICETIKDEIGELKLSNLSKTGNSYGLDYMIGNTEYIGQGYGAKTLIYVVFCGNVRGPFSSVFLIFRKFFRTRYEKIF